MTADTEMKRRASPCLPGVIVLGVTACTAPGLDRVETDTEMSAGTTGPTTPGGATGDTAPTTVDPAPSTSTGEPGTTATATAGGSTGELGSTTASATTTLTGDEPLAPPAIVDHVLDPDPLQQAGPIAVTIATAHAMGVRMQIDGGPFIELVDSGADNFSGEIAVYTALDNGPHTATFVAWRDGLESQTLELPFNIALPPVGSELFWDGDNAIGQGTVVALAVTPARELIELGTYYPQGQARCYLRRRDLGGSWGPGDFVDVKPDIQCSAIDLAVDDDGALLVLADKIENGELRWWLGKIAAWGEAPTNVGSGVVDEAAHALAADLTRVAVCGTRPKPNHVDAAIWLFQPNATGKVLSFDYMSGLDLPIRFNETPSDCHFLGDRLMLTGTVRGRHEGDVVQSRHFLLGVDLVTEQPTWTVAGKGPGTQSEGLTLDIDATGRIITGGHTCGDVCDPVGELRLFSPGQELLWQRILDPAIASPRGVAWHPAGYVVFVSARDAEQASTSFFAQAWSPLQGAPLWSYEHQDALDFHTAAAVTIGPYGQIYAGGMTAGGYPALAFINP